MRLMDRTLMGGFGRERRRGVAGRALELLLTPTGFSTAGSLSYGSEPTALGLVGVLRMIDSEEVKRVPAPQVNPHSHFCDRQELPT